MSEEASTSAASTSTAAPAAPAPSPVEDSLAFSLIDDLKRGHKLTDAQHEQYQDLYRVLHGRVIEAREKQAGLVKMTKRKQNDVLGEKIKLERSMEKLAAEMRELENLEKDRDAVNKQLDEAEKKDAVNKYELTELERVHGELTNMKDDLVADNARTVLPELERLEKELKALEKEFKRQGEAQKKEDKAKEELLERHEGLGEELARAKKEQAELEKELKTAQDEPARVRKQAESVHKAAKQLESDTAALRERIAHNENVLARQRARRAEAEEALSALKRKLGNEQAHLEARQAEVAELQKLLDGEHNAQHELATEQVELELVRRGHEQELHRASEELSSTKKEYENKKRRVRKQRNMVDSVREVIPTLAAHLLDSEHSLRSYKEENGRIAAEIEEARREVELGMASFLKQETLAEGKRAELEEVRKALAAQEEEVVRWQAEERKQGKLLVLLAAQREIKARALTKAQHEEKVMAQELKVKELALLDLAKKCNEANNKLKESTALYDVVKNERNKYLNLIAASSQALAEMKEKIRVLGSEVEILRNESVAKDKALAKEVSAHALSKAARDSLRLELNKGQQEYRRKQRAVQNQIEDVKALNSVINRHEREMLRLQRRYQDAVRKRNDTGVGLIDRNDELLVLYEKSNLQAQTLEAGNAAVREREDEVRGLKLELTELERQLRLARKAKPAGGELAQRHDALTQALGEARAKTASLTLELESTANPERFRELAGRDPDLPELEEKTRRLEARLEEKKGLLLEKELVLEEVTTLTQKLKNRAGDGREETLKMGVKVNQYQGKIRDVTRRMMATVSELSMYQATAMKLQQEKNAAKTELEEAKWRLAHGKPPSEDAEREWYHLEQAALAKQEARLLGKHQPQGGAAALPATAVRTTAEPRPNAYIPDELGIPKPYGKLGPFKPTEAGATMRHMRAPVHADIEI